LNEKNLLDSNDYFCFITYSYYVWLLMEGSQQWFEQLNTNPISYSNTIALTYCYSGLYNL